MIIVNVVDLVALAILCICGAFLLLFIAVNSLINLVRNSRRQNDDK